MICVICKTEFATNYKRKITCSPECRRIQKNAQKMDVYYSDRGYKAKKEQKIKSNSFLNIPRLGK